MGAAPFFPGLIDTRRRRCYALRVNLHQALANLLYPPACLLCRTPLAPSADAATRSATICPACLGRMPPNSPPVCLRCGLGLAGAFDATVECESCRTSPPAFERARAPLQYTGAAQEAVRQFKYHRRWRVGRWLAEEMVRVAKASFPIAEVAAVLPVPRHWLKRRLQGFNAAELLACAIAPSLEKPCVPDVLRQRRWTATQTRLSWRERARNVRGAFTAQGRSVGRRAVLLIDDVLTSGATAHACAQALREAGALRVFVLTAARTPLG